MHTTPTLEGLLNEAGWLRTLAASLASDTAQADDLVQDTWLAALRREPRPGEARPWLGRVVRNLARNRWREGERRSARERLSREEQPVSTPGELAEAAEAQRLLAEAVTRLPEGLRDVVVLVYFQGLDSRRAGERLGLSPSAVRTRLQSALAMLRADLDRRTPGGREAWLSMLAGWARSGDGPAGAVAAAGPAGIGAALSAPAVLAVLVLGGSLGAALYAVRGGQAGAAARGGAAPSVASLETTAPVEPSIQMATAPVPSRPEDERAIAGTPARAPASSAAPIDAAVGDLTVSGTILVDGAPPQWPLLLTLAPPRPPPDARGLVQRTRRIELELEPEQQGAFGLLCPPDSPAQLVLQVEDYRMASGDPGLEVSVPSSGLVVHLRSGPAVLGRLLDPRGAPCERVEGRGLLRLGADDALLHEEELSFTTIADGRFRIPLDGPAHDPSAVWAEIGLRVELPGAGFLELEAPRFVSAEGLDLGELRLEAVRPILVHVRDPEGRAIEGASVSIASESIAKLSFAQLSIAQLSIDGSTTATCVLTDERGTVVLEHAPARPPADPIVLRIRAPRYAEERVPVVEDEVSVELARLAVLDLRMQGPGAARVARVTLSADGPATVPEAWPALLRPGMRLARSAERPLELVEQQQGEVRKSRLPTSDGGRRIALAGLVPDRLIALELTDSDGLVLATTSALLAAGEWAELELWVP